MSTHIAKIDLRCNITNIFFKKDKKARHISDMSRKNQFHKMQIKLIPFKYTRLSATRSIIKDLATDLHGDTMHEIQT
jgi:hypothetical protein